MRTADTGIPENTSTSDSIYGSERENLEQILHLLLDRIETLRTKFRADDSDPVEHCLGRIKSEASMREKCRRRNLPETTDSALTEIRDAIGIRIVCAFLNDVYMMRDYIAGFDDIEIVEEKDYIRHAKPNGYRSLHLILQVRTESPAGDSTYAPAGDSISPRPDEVSPPPASGSTAGRQSYFVEIQLRTISMDTWAALEHHMKYKKEVSGNTELLVSELKRCADELASTDLSMQTLRDMIRGM